MPTDLCVRTVARPGRSAGMVAVRPVPSEADRSAGGWTAVSVLERPTATHEFGVLTGREITACRPDVVRIRRATRRLRSKAAFIAALTIGSYLGLVFVAHGPLLALPLAAVLVIALVATATSVMHDANHGAFGGSQGFNRTL